MKKILVIVGLCCLISGSTLAQSREGILQTGVGVGFAAHDPAQFDLNFNGHYFYTDEISIGMNFDILMRSKSAVYSFLPLARYHVDLVKNPRFVPYVGGGLGMQIASGGNAWFDLMIPDLGFDYEFTPHLFVGPDVSFHLLAGNGNTTWDLHLLGQIAYRF